MIWETTGQCTEYSTSCTYAANPGSVTDSSLTSRLAAFTPPATKTSITAQSRNIKKIPPKIFVPYTVLTDLRLDNNIIDEVYCDSFDGLTTLTELRLENNKLGMVPNISHMSNLVRLHLYNNDITHIPIGHLGTMPDLIQLFLQENPIKCIDDQHIFDSFPNLNMFKMFDTELTKYPCQNHTTLQQFYISHASFQTFNDCKPFLKLPSLTHFELSYSALKEFPDLIGASNLRSLNLRNDQIDIMPNGTNLTFPNNSLTEILLYYHKFKTFPNRFFDRMNKLEAFNASYGAAEVPEDHFMSREEQLTLLDFYLNSIQKLPNFTGIETHYKLNHIKLD